MEVRDHKVTVLLLRIGGSSGVHNTGEAPHHEHPDETNTEDHRRIETYATTPECANPVKDIYPGGYRYGHRQEGEGGGCHFTKTGSEHVVRPHCKAEEANHCTREHHDRVAEEWLFGEGRKYLRDDPHRR